ncbi:MAG: SHOCT domain-containing protein [Planctomycetota bacterium]
MGESEEPIIAGGCDGPRPFGTGQLLMFVGLGMCLVFTLLALVRGLDVSGFGWVPMSQIVLLVIEALAVVAVVMSLKESCWLLVGYGFAGLILVMLIGNVSTLSAPVCGGHDFFVMLGAALVAVGTYMAQKGICVWSGRLGEGGPEAQLARLKEMRDQDLITEEEYNRKREQLLDQM